MDFVGFNKMPRLSRDMIITEKIDGTNAQVCIIELEGYEEPTALYQKDGLALLAGSRTRWIDTNNDNYGFAHWCLEHAEELMQLGPGRHFGEWWGMGIQRGYGLKEKRFSLFNTTRWESDPNLPGCCHVVPVLSQGIFDTFFIHNALENLAKYGSYAAPGFMRPEGIVVYHVAGNLSFKKTIEKDDQPKGFRP